MPVPRGRGDLVCSLSVPGHYARADVRKPSVLIGAEQRLLAEGLQALLSDFMDVVGLPSDGVALVKAAGELKPDFVLLDFKLPKLSGIEAAQVIHRKRPETRLVLLADDFKPDQVSAARRAGASVYLLKSIGIEELKAVIEKIANGDQREGQAQLAAAAPSSSLEEQADSDPTALTPRQREVLQLTVEGFSAREIGDVLSISTKTVEFHKSELRKALRLSSTAQLIRYALKHRIVA